MKKIRHYVNYKRSQDPFWNLAVEEYLLETVEPDTCVLYLWQNANTVVIGKNQNAWSECRIEALEAAGGHLARRLSGGGAVYHDLGNLNFTFLAHRDSYDVDRQLQVIVHAARAFGIAAVKTGRNDLEADGHKFSGNAFYKKQDRCYHHGTILIQTDSTRMAEYLQVSAAKLASKGVASVRSRVVNLAELSDAVTVDAFADQMICSFSHVYGVPSEQMNDEELPVDVLREKQARFASELWRYGRNIPLQAQSERKFSWGLANLGFSIECGQIVDVVLYTDGLDVTLPELLANELRGCVFRMGAIAQRIQKLCKDFPEQKEVLQDLLQLIQSDFF